MQRFNHDSDELFLWYELRKIYLFYDAVHLVKKIRYKWFIFTSFKLDGFKDPINVSGEE